MTHQMFSTCRDNEKLAFPDYVLSVISPFIALLSVLTAYNHDYLSLPIFQPLFFVHLFSTTKMVKIFSLLVDVQIHVDLLRV